MSTTTELNNWIEQQENSKEQNAVMNKQATVNHKNNNLQIDLLEKENELIVNSIELRNNQDTAIDKSVLQYKKMIRNGEYGEENKDMKFIDEE